MQYRTLSKKIDFQPSALGFGLMRLPMKDEKTVDRDESIKMIRHAVDNGVNYLDTAYIYHNGESEKILAEVLKDGYRQKVKIADKHPLWLVKTEADLDRIFFDQLEKLQVDKIDFYLLHSLSNYSFENCVMKYKLAEWGEKKKSDGYIDYLGFSFHDDLACLKKIIDYHTWDFCMVQFNLIDIKQQLSIEGLRYAKQKDMGVIVMEPLRGSQLTSSYPDEIVALWKEMSKLYSHEEMKPVQYLLDYIWNYEEVGFLLSGMSNMQHVKDNLTYADQAKIGKLDEKQLELFLEIQTAYLKRIMINCTKCDYCKVCPQKIAIPEIFDSLNEVKRYDNQKNPTFRYNFLPEEKRASKCTSCGECKAICPQKLDIPVLLSKCADIFERNKAFDEGDFSQFRV